MRELTEAGAASSSGGELAPWRPVGRSGAWHACAEHGLLQMLPASVASCDQGSCVVLYMFAELVSECGCVVVHECHV